MLDLNECRKMSAMLRLAAVRIDELIVATAGNQFPDVNNDEWNELIDGSKNISVRTQNILRRMGFARWADMVGVKLSSIRSENNCGITSLNEIVEKLKRLNIPHDADIRI